MITDLLRTKGRSTIQWVKRSGLIPTDFCSSAAWSIYRCRYRTMWSGLDCIVFEEGWVNWYNTVHYLLQHRRTPLQSAPARHPTTYTSTIVRYNVKPIHTFSLSLFDSILSAAFVTKSVMSLKTSTSSITYLRWYAGCTLRAFNFSWYCCFISARSTNGACKVSKLS